MRARSGTRGILAAFVGLVLGSALHASTTVVPDDHVTIQAALDSGADSVLVRAGDYSERPVLRRSVVLAGLPASGVRPRVQGIIVRSESGYDVDMRVEHFAHLGAIQLRTPSYGNDGVAFVSCTLDSGLVQPERFEFWDYGIVEIARSTIAGSVITGAVAHVRCIEDTFSTGGVAVSGDVPWLTVERSRFSGNEYHAILVHEGRLYARDNHVEGSYGNGIRAWRPDLAEISGNRVVGCSEYGIDFQEGVARDNTVEGCGVGISASFCRVENNRVLDCGYGIRASEAQVISNLVLGSSGVGIEANPEPGLRVERNVVGRGAGDGIQVATGSFTDVVIASNTSFRNAGHGFRLGPVWHHGAVIRNIAFENGGYGLLADSTTAQTSCNDWFGNVAGGARGMPSDGSDLAVDPLFCNVDSDSVTLFASSPLVNAPDCGLVGARGVGCETAATPLPIAPSHLRLAPVTPNPSAGAVRIRWSSPREEWVDVTVHDLAGRTIAIVARGTTSAGAHEAVWEGGGVPSGVYFVRLRSAGFTVTRSFLVRR